MKKKRMLMGAGILIFAAALAAGVFLIRRYMPTSERMSSEEYFGALDNGEAAVIVEALGEDELPATVSFVSPTVTTSSMGSSTYAIEIALDDVNTDLRIGMTAQASIVLEAAYDVLTVPYDCVETDEDGNSVVYVDQDGERTAVSVEVGMQGDYYVEVSGDGLDENTMVYYNTPLVNSEATDSGDDSGAAVTFTGGGGGGMPGGGGPGGGF